MNIIVLQVVLLKKEALLQLGYRRFLLGVVRAAVQLLNLMVIAMDRFLFF